MITEDYVSYEVAKLLKEKDFHEKVNHVYHYYTSAPFYQRHLRDFNGEDYKNLRHEYYSAPTLQMVMKWLREMHNIIIEPNSVWNGRKWEYLLFVVTSQNADSPYYEHNPYKSYEECVEAAIKYCLENLI